VFLYSIVDNYVFNSSKQPYDILTASRNMQLSTWCFLLARQPTVSQGLLIQEVSWSHTTTRHSR